MTPFPPLRHADYLKSDKLELYNGTQHSADKGRIWTNRTPTPDSIGGLLYGYRRKPQGIFTDPETGDLLEIVLAMDTPSLDTAIIEPPVALAKYYLRYRMSPTADTLECG